MAATNKDGAEEFVTVRYHKRVARWTMVLAWFTLFLTLATIAGTYLSIEDTKEKFIYTRRPFVSLYSNGSFGFKWWVADSSNTVSSYSIVEVLQNVGSTPAVGMKITSRFYKTPASGRHSQIVDPSMPSFDDSAIILSPSDVYDFSTARIPISDLLEVADGKRRMFLILRTEYQDILGSGRTYHFNTCNEINVLNKDKLLHPSEKTSLSEIFEVDDCGKYDVAD